MSITRIMVHYDNTPRADRALASALTLAEAQDAHLIGCTCRVDPQLPGYVAAQVPAEVVEGIVKEQQRIVSEAHAKFEEKARASGWFDRCEFVEGEGDPAVVLTRFGRGTDLLVVGQAEPGNESREIEELPDNLVMEVGRPVLVIPYIGTHPTLGEEVLLCWTDTREAARAMHDSLDLFKAATRVTVLTITNSNNHDDVPGEDAARFLAAHGVNVRLNNVVSKSSDAGNEILNQAADIGADLIVMGAYGHSRLRETILGGATRTILKSMTVPVLMSH